MGHANSQALDLERGPRPLDKPKRRPSAYILKSGLLFFASQR
jgi:hypothetical protein